MSQTSGLIADTKVIIVRVKELVYISIQLFLFHNGREILKNKPDYELCLPDHSSHHWRRLFESRK